MKAKPRPIVFLHLPKTGGQTVHHAIGAVVGAENISPVRVHWALPDDGVTFPPGYRFHSGHLEWHDLEQIPDNPFSFMVLRAPRERLGSQYFYMRRKAEEKAAAQGQAALNKIEQQLVGPTPAFFFRFGTMLTPVVRRRWANLTTHYLCFRTLNPTRAQTRTNGAQRIADALKGAKVLSALYRPQDFGQLETDIAVLTGTRPQITGKDSNAGPLEPSRSRWGTLLERFEKDGQIRAMEQLVELDEELMSKLTFRSSGESNIG
ncbi:MAG: sulfotransferase family 2 domain-containing protein [Rhodobacteraceae bacterium]|nr:sulfotransferase family 2 domain-containing protein [Paracoccaceae bacterium]